MLHSSLPHATMLQNTLTPASAGAFLHGRPSAISCCEAPRTGGTGRLCGRPRDEKSRPRSPIVNDMPIEAVPALRKDNVWPIAR
jgi:hypothetical protein